MAAAKCTPGLVFLWTGMILGNLEYLLYVVWGLATDFQSGTAGKACALFLLTQPLWSLFIYVLYIGQHADLANSDRCRKLAIGPLFMLAMQAKVLSGHDGVHRRFCARFDLSETKFALMTRENLYRVQTVLEFFLLTVPMMIVVSSYCNTVEWTTAARLAIAFAALMFTKNLSVMTIFAIRKFIDGAENPPMRPRSSPPQTRVELEAFNHIQSYLIEPHDDGMDPDGNTTVH